MATQQDQPNPARSRLRDHFASNPTDSSRWDRLWEQSYTPWDQARPNPALIDLLASRHPALASDAGRRVARRPRALVPGCGRGYDVLLLAAWGFDAFGVDVSATAAAEAARVLARLDAERGGEDGEGIYGTKNDAVGRGEARVLIGDFFKDEWWLQSCRDNKDQGCGDRERFDLIYDYTFFCALPRPLRPAWAARMSELLAPGGRLICLEFPTYKEPSTGGPPWCVRPNEYVAYLSKPGEKIQYGEDDLATGIDEEKPELGPGGLVRAAHMRPARSHEVGQGTDFISIWKHQ